MLAWNRDAARPISAEEAFHLYKRNWRQVDAERLTLAEAELVRRLTAVRQGRVSGALTPV
jgi:hypothetical protein